MKKKQRKYKVATTYLLYAKDESYLLNLHYEIVSSPKIPLYQK